MEFCRAVVDDRARDWVKVVEAVGIEPLARRYANPTRTLDFPAYRCQPRATRTLTHVPRSTLESPCLPCALVTMWSLRVPGRGERGGSGETVHHDMDHLGDTDPVIKIFVCGKR